MTTLQSIQHHIMDTELTAEAVMPEFKSHFARSMAREEEGGGEKLVTAGTEDQQTERLSSQSRLVSDNFGSVGSIVFGQTGGSENILALAREGVVATGRAEVGGCSV